MDHISASTSTTTRTPSSVNSLNQESGGLLMPVPSFGSFDINSGDTKPYQSLNDKSTNYHKPPESQAITSTEKAPQSQSGSFRKHYDAVFTNWWLLEVLSWILGAAALIAVSVILQEYDGKSLSSWTFPITPNSMISLFATISKAALLLPVAEGLGQLKWNWFRNPRPLADIVIFDSASRGPWGALQLILKGRPLSTLGALLVVTALAVDPFVQQVITYNQVMVWAGASAIPRAQIYNRTGLIEIHGGKSNLPVPSPNQSRVPIVIYYT